MLDNNDVQQFRSVAFDNKNLISTLSDFDTTLVTYLLIIGSAKMTTVLPRNETTDILRKRL